MSTVSVCRASSTRLRVGLGPVALDQDPRHFVAERRRCDRKLAQLIEAHASPFARQGVASPAQERAAHLVAVGRSQVGSRRERTRVDHQRVERAFAQGACQQFGAATRDLEVESRMVRGHVHQQRRHQHGTRPRAEPDAQRSGHAARQLLAALAQVVGCMHELTCALDDLAPEGRDFAVAADAVEQRLAQFGFERTDAAAQGGLGQEQGVRRPAERAGLRQRNEVSQLDECHRRSPRGMCV
jgi:hypothetical protein